MNRSFIVFDKLNSVAFDCYTLVSFNFENTDYLVYYLVKDDSNCGIFVSKLVKGTEDKYLLSDISNEEKTGLGDIPQNIFVKLPSSYSDGIDINKLINDFCSDNNIMFLKSIPKLEDQSLCKNSNLSDSTLEYSDYVKTFYDAIIPRVNISPTKTTTLVWELPSSSAQIEEVSPITDNNFSESLGVGNIGTIIPVTSNDYTPSLPLESTEDHSINNIAINQIPVTDTYDFNSYGNSLNLDNEKNANISNSISNEKNINVSNSTLNKQDTNISNNTSFEFNIPSEFNSQSFSYDNSSDSKVSNQLNNVKIPKESAGFVINSNIIIGTVCLILSSIIVAVSIFFVNRL